MSKSKLQGDFELLRGHCIEIRQNFNTYNELFSPENDELLSDTAATFFSDIAEIMHRDWLLQACKLMDGATTQRKGQTLENISIKLINLQLEEQSLINSKINDVAASILSYGKKIVPARQKRLAHYDRDHQIRGVILGGSTEEELNEFLLNLQSYCDLVGEAIGIGPLDLSYSACSGDVFDLLKLLRDRNKSA